MIRPRTLYTFLFIKKSFLLNIKNTKKKTYEHERALSLLFYFILLYWTILILLYPRDIKRTFLQFSAYFTPYWKLPTETQTHTIIIKRWTSERTIETEMHKIFHYRAYLNSTIFNTFFFVTSAYYYILRDPFRPWI